MVLKQYYYHYKTCKLIQALEEKKEKKTGNIGSEEEIQAYCLSRRKNTDNTGSKKDSDSDK